MDNSDFREQIIRGEAIMEDAKRMYFGEEPLSPAIEAHMSHEKDGIAAKNCQFCPQVEDPSEEKEINDAQEA